MRTLILTIWIALSVGVAFPASSQAQFQLYDNFKQKRLDPTKWYGQQADAGELEFVRRIMGGWLEMAQRVFGGDDADTGRRISRNRLRFPNDYAMTGLGFKLKVKALSLQGCEVPGSSASMARARGVMFLFNDGSGTEPSDAEGDVGAVVEVFRSSDSEDEGDMFRARGFLFYCLDRRCQRSRAFAHVALGVVKRNERVKLAMQWHPETNSVSFWKNNKHEEMTEEITYTEDDAALSVFSNQRLELRSEAANCTAGERPYAAIKARFDNVYVHP